MAGVAAAYLLARWPGRRDAVISVVCAAFLLLQFPTLDYFSTVYRGRKAVTLRGDIEETMVWLRDRTPSAGDPYRPSTLPAYGILSRWDYGGWIESVALRPTLATSYGTETYGMEEVARFLLAENREEMDVVLRRNRIRYLVIDNVTGDLHTYGRLVGNTDRYFSTRKDPVTGKISHAPTPQLFGLVSSRLFFADGSFREAGALHFEPVEGVRLCFESSSPSRVNGLPWEVRRIKVFEVADGAELVVTAAPGSTVSLSQEVETNTGRRFVYRCSRQAEANGTVRFRVMYPAKSGIRETGAVRPVLLESTAGSRRVTLTDGEIEAGRPVAVRLGGR
jgi:dolichyl-diphosphooligosaccharide--protein glycosyltransferase